MAPDDPRHGRPSGYREGCRCDPCRLTWNRKNKRWEVNRLRNGGRTTVPVEPFIEPLRALKAQTSQRAIATAVGASDGYISRVLRGEITNVSVKRATDIQRVLDNPIDLGSVGGAYVSSIPSMRRLRALSALGYSHYRLADACGLSRNAIMAVFLERAPMIHGDTHAKIKATYDQLCMSLPVAKNRADLAGINRARRRAEREGWPPPLAWNNPDDPDETPAGWQYRPAAFEDQIRELIDRGAGISEACRVLHMSREAIEKRLERRGMRAEYRTLTGRETRRANGAAEEVA